MRSSANRVVNVMWMTADEAALKWNLSKRTVQHLCKEGKIIGATHFNRSWAIPKNATRPSKSMTGIGHQLNTEELPPLDHHLTLKDFELIMNQCPYSMHISNAQGTMVFANSRFMEGALDDVHNHAIGHYNIFLEPQLDAWGLRKHVTKAFKGELVTTKMLKFPNKELVDIRYGKEYAFFNIYQDITSMPIFSPEGQLSFVVTFFVPSEKHFDRSEVMEAKAFIDAHWIEPLSIQEIAKHVSLSVSRLTQLFKAETGFTLHDYYHDIKMRHICELLIHPDLMITDVFNRCGISYNSHYSSLFKAYTGITPRQYRANKKRFE